MSDSFWAAIEGQLDKLREARTVDDVVGVLADPPAVIADYIGDGCSGDAFFAGSGGDTRILDVLIDAGWRTTWFEASYYYVLEAPDGGELTYIEGDIYRGDRATVRS